MCTKKTQTNLTWLSVCAYFTLLLVHHSDHTGTDGVALRFHAARKPLFFSVWRGWLGYQGLQERDAVPPDGELETKSSPPCISITSTCAGVAMTDVKNEQQKWTGSSSVASQRSCLSTAISIYYEVYFPQENKGTIFPFFWNRNKKPLKNYTAFIDWTVCWDRRQ